MSDEHEEFCLFWDRLFAMMTNNDMLPGFKFDDMLDTHGPFKVC